MAFVRVSCILLLPLMLLAIANAAEEAMVVSEGMDAMHDPRYLATILEKKGLTSVVGETYCCLKNGYGCMQECEKGKAYQCCLKNGYGCMQMCEPSKKYSCCLKNGYGCMWMCENGVEHYCCEKNGYGCTKMCPKKVTSGSL
ncbi:hypothetical protein SELMODRAFT_440532 [Selaginella moellendorffii]|uniref:Granulins domain-containing protein n=1 Tax=Selaginella moellendorffii TaxID=88036 RepID=D8RCC8_SELML|nr:uncharacterized protein LOC9651672 [Selaginella moellendorffii]XP_002990599.1 uncharacterized protein LOC9662866 [Selaginella moellendorffii]EFJ08231.1 hypothetical protein SELMODRAFT_429026 [Selaginella moellendorffii]EFJ29829.1 hypothetical protein SELMODRAFT_440532 [Selaginella moellendorffii]|eukprot:XP_002968713.1 uncharacterized protein LOC9651672 [Selaginella moellendorffii]